MLLEIRGGGWKVVTRKFSFFFSFFPFHFSAPWVENSYFKKKKKSRRAKFTMEKCDELSFLSKLPFPDTDCSFPFLCAPSPQNSSFLGQLGLTSGSEAEMYVGQGLRDEKKCSWGEEYRVQRKETGQHPAPRGEWKSSSKAEEEILHMQDSQINRLFRAYHFCRILSQVFFTEK